MTAIFLLECSMKYKKCLKKVSKRVSNSKNSLIDTICTLRIQMLTSSKDFSQITSQALKTSSFTCSGSSLINGSEMWLTLQNLLLKKSREP